MSSQMDTSDSTPTRSSTKRPGGSVDRNEVKKKAQKIGKFMYDSDSDSDSEDENVQTYAQQHVQTYAQQHVQTDAQQHVQTDAQQHVQTDAQRPVKTYALGDVVAPNPFTRPFSSSSSEYISVPTPEWEKKLYFIDLSVLVSIYYLAPMVSELNHQEENFRTINGILEVGLPFNMYYKYLNKTDQRCSPPEYTACVEFILQCIKDRNRNEAQKKGDDLNHGVKAVTIDNYRKYVDEKKFDWSTDNRKCQKAFWSEEDYDINWNTGEQNILRVYPTSTKYELTDQDLADFGRCNFRKLGILYFLTHSMQIPCLRIVTIAVLFDRIKKMSAEELGNREGNLWGHAV